VSDTDSTFSDSQSLGVSLARHLETCSECIETFLHHPTGFGSVTQLCSEYQSIIAEWANREGEINNVVDHDEFGNQASTAIHERYPDQWR